jgi:hypothetical protein
MLAVIFRLLPITPAIRQQLLHSSSFHNKFCFPEGYHAQHGFQELRQEPLVCQVLSSIHDIDSTTLSQLLANHRPAISGPRSRPSRRAPFNTPRNSSARPMIRWFASSCPPLPPPSSAGMVCWDKLELLLITLCQTQLPPDYIDLEKRVDALKQAHQKMLAVT